MRASTREQAIGCDDGEYLIARCPRDWDVSTPQSLWEENPSAESLTYTLGKWLSPADVHQRTLIYFIAPTKRALKIITLNDREWTMLREYEAKRNYAAIGRKHGITRERARQIVTRAQRVAAYRRVVGLASPDDEGDLDIRNTEAQLPTGTGTDPKGHTLRLSPDVGAPHPLNAPQPSRRIGSTTTSRLASLAQSEG